MSTRIEKSYCRICPGLCGMSVTIDNTTDRIVGIRGDKSHPLTHGYACIKGLQAVEAHYGARRLLQAQKRCADGSHDCIPMSQALDEIAAILRDIVARHGAEAVAAYRGTLAFFNTLANRMMQDWLHSIGSNSFYSSMTIDQSAKYVTIERLGMWAGGVQAFADSDVWMLVGNNPLVSVSGSQLSANPTRTFREARARGLKLIVIDPRESETAHYADVFLQIVPGEDVTVAAGLIRIVLTEGWHDRDFCARFVDQLDVLGAAVDPYTPEFVARRAGVEAGKLRAAAELFARIGQRGTAQTGTGMSMAPHSNLADHLYNCLNVICGRFPRAGEALANPGVFVRFPPSEQVYPPRRSWERGAHSHVGGYGMLFGEKMTGNLANEILTPGKGQIRALISVGGNPAGAFPDQERTLEALQALDLLVAIDPVRSETARFAHYILPPTLMYEQSNVGPLDFEIAFFPQPFAAYAPALVRPPPGAELIDDWRVFWELAKRLGVRLKFAGAELDMSRAPTDDELYAQLLRFGPVPFDEIRRKRGRVLDIEPVRVAPAPEAKGRFAVAPSDVVTELAQVREERPPHGFTHLLSSRRTREVSNTMYHDFPAIRRRMTYNPAYLHPDDLTKLGLKSGDRVHIVSERDRIEAIVEDDARVRPGVVSMSHGWGGLPVDGAPYEEVGASTSRLVSLDRCIEPINAMPRLSAIPVRIERCA